MPRPTIPPPGAVEHSGPWAHGGFQSFQVNVDREGRNIVGDAANEPSLAVDPTNPNNIVIGWRQFDSVNSDFRQAGYAYSRDAGQTWTFPGVLDPGQFRSDPVLGVDAEGNFYYYNIRCGSNGCGDIFRSEDGGRTWAGPFHAVGGDREWMTVDATEGPGSGHVYASWGGSFVRSVDGGRSVEGPFPVSAFRGHIAVGLESVVYVIRQADSGGTTVSRSLDARDPDQSPSFERIAEVYVGGATSSNAGPNPGGGLGPLWIAVDHSDKETRGNLYILGSVNPPGNEPLDVMFVRSTDEGQTWSDPIRVNDDDRGTDAWQWFAAMSVAPNGRIDAVWYDTRIRGRDNISELYYSFSSDGGLTWSENIAVSPSFNSWIGWPRQSKIGDYIHMLSDNVGVNVAYAATFNGEQDVYLLRIGDLDCNMNGIGDTQDIDDGTSEDCDLNGVPDECDLDCNGNGRPDACDIADGISEDADGNGIADECQVLFVDGRADGANDGMSWEDAFDDLQDALQVAGDLGYVSEIRVAGGVYKPDGGTLERGRSFDLAVDLTIRGGYAGTLGRQPDHRDLVRFETILSGDLRDDDQPDFQNRNDNSYHVLQADGFLDGVATLDGITVAAGNANGSGDRSRGGALFMRDAACVVIDSRILGNRAQGQGGAVYSQRGRLVASRSVFIGNRSHFSSGGAIYAWLGESVDCTNCIFVDNEASGQGGSIFVGGDLLSLSDSSLVRNRSSLGGGIYHTNASDPAITSTVLWENSDDGGMDESAQISGSRTSTVDINYSIVQGWTGDMGGVGNFGDDPRFVDVEGGNLRLLGTSPAIDAGDPSQESEGQRDLDGHARVLCGRVDMGAYEFGIGDHDCDRAVTLDDYAAWEDCMTGPAGGPYADGCEAFDFEFDDDVDLRDFAEWQGVFSP